MSQKNCEKILLEYLFPVLCYLVSFPFLTAYQHLYGSFNVEDLNHNSIFYVPLHLLDCTFTCL